VKAIAERGREWAQQQLVQALFDFIESVGEALLNKVGLASCGSWELREPLN
jgi:hypothetical protein